ncbi:hyalin-like, partial [Anneissia japonica]|uniref:hyalin-like n=1 Tax=Anneissia japonica TaxID=1529436 RepID=UPI001425BAC0
MLVTLIIPITVVNLVAGYTKCNIKDLQSTAFKYYGRKNTTVKNEIKTLRGISKYVCLIKCRKHSLCLAFSYATSSSLCKMYEHDSESANVTLIPEAGVWFYDMHNNTDFIQGNVDSCVQGHRCFNGGSCRNDSSSSGYFCTCTDNYHGQFCQDINGPPILKCPSNQIVTADSDCMATATWKPPKVINNTGYSFTAVCDYVSGSTFSNYSTIVTCNATDDFENVGNCNFTVTIYDETAPNVTCPFDIEVCTDLGTYSVNATWEAANASDNCCSKVDIGLTTNYTSGEPLSLGVYTVGYTATDCFEKTAYCKFTVKVKDCEAPVLKCPPNINVTGDDYMATTFWTAPTVTDNSGYSFTPMCDYMNGSSLSKPNTTVTCNATDDYDNTGYCTFNIFII